MIVGEQFAWGHLGKTAGDATHALFTRVTPDLVLDAHDPDDRRKHRPFGAAGLEVLRKPILVLNVRRLPSWILSYSQHRSRHGTPEDRTPRPVPSADAMADSTRPDEELSLFTLDGRLRIDRWLRQEQLRDDFLAFVETLRPVTTRERLHARMVATKPQAGYDHDVSNVFDRDQVGRLYERNPHWATVEREVYGDLVTERWTAP